MTLTKQWKKFQHNLTQQDYECFKLKVLKVKRCHSRHACDMVFLELNRPLTVVRGVGMIFLYLYEMHTFVDSCFGNALAFAQIFALTNFNYHLKLLYLGIIYC